MVLKYPYTMSIEYRAYDLSVNSIPVRRFHVDGRFKRRNTNRIQYGCVKRFEIRNLNADSFFKHTIQNCFTFCSFDTNFQNITPWRQCDEI